MSDYLPFIVIGVTAGSIYAMAALGLVVTYTTSGVFNFAHGAVGMIVAYVFLTLREDTFVPTALAVAVCVVVVAPLIGLLLDRVLFRRLAEASPTNAVVASIGLLVALQGVAIRVYGPATRPVDPLLPKSTFVTLGNLRIGVDQVAVVAIAAALALGLVLLFRRTRLGLETRTVVDNRELAGLVGIDARRVSAVSWMLGCSFAGLSGILIAPFLGLDAVLLTLLVLQALGSAVVGRLRNLPATYFAAIAIGVAAAVSTKFVATNPALAGLPNSLPFLVLFATLVVSRRDRFVEIVDERQMPGSTRPRGGFEPSFPWPTLVAVLAAAVMAGSVVDDTALLTLTATVAFVLVFESLGILVGQARLVSLSHAAFVAFGATTLAHLLSAGVPYGLALLLSGLFVAPVGAMLAVPALRLPGLFLAIATFGFGILVQYLVFPTGLAFGADALASLARPAIAESEQGFFLFSLVVVGLGVAVIEWLRAGRVGVLLKALADSPVAVRSMGISPVVSRVLVFSIAAFFAAVAGGLLASLTQVVNPASFTFQDSLLWLTVLVAAGPRTLGGAVVAALLLNQLSAGIDSPQLLELLPISFGVSAILLAQTPNGLTGLVGDRLATGPGRRAGVRPRARHQERVRRLAARAAEAL